MKKIIFGIIFLLVFVNSLYSLQYQGVLTSSSGLKGTGYWSYGVKFEWVVTFMSTSDLWKYEYKLTVPRKYISNMIIEVSDLFNCSNVFCGTTPGYEIGTYPTPGNSAPYIPDEIRGIKFEACNVTVFPVTIITDKSPVWGDFYAKNGYTCGVYNTVYNLGFVNPDTDPYLPASNGSINYHILRPDTLIVNDVPEPLSIIFFIFFIPVLLKKRF